MLQNQHLYKKTCCFTTQCPLFGKAPKKSTTCSRKTRTVDFFGENGVQKVDFRKCWKSITQTKCCFLSKLGYTKSIVLFPPGLQFDLDLAFWNCWWINNPDQMLFFVKTGVQKMECFFLCPWIHVYVTFWKCWLIRNQTWWCFLKAGYRS